MIRFYSYFLIQFKKKSRSLVVMLLGSVCIIVLVAAVLFLLQRSQDKNAINKTRVGLVMNSDNRFEGLVTGAMNSLGSIGKTFSFDAMTEEEGMKKMKDGEINTLFIVPDGYVESLILGRNYPVIVRYSGRRPDVSTLLVRQLTKAATSYILDTEAGIYSVKDWYKSMGSSLPISNESELNWRYLNLIVARNTMLKEEVIETRESLPLSTYYTAAGIALLLLLIGLCCQGMFRMEDRSLPALLRVRGLSFLKQSLAGATSFTLTYLIWVVMMSVIAIIPLWIFTDINPLSGLMMIPAAYLAAVIIRLIFVLIKHPVYSLLGLLMVIIIMGFMSGYFYPLSYLPHVFRSIGSFLSTRLIFEWARDVITGDISVGLFLLIMGYGIVLDIVTLLIDAYSLKRRCGA